MMNETIQATEVTRRLADYVVRATPTDLPADARASSVRTFLNWAGCATGSSHHETLDVALAALAPFSGPATASVLGRRERLDPLTAALMNGISSHVFDFDDTHLRTVIHPAGPVASALLAFAEYRTVSGPDFINALALGIEVECRIGNAVYPEHYDVGWHITGSTGGFGAAAAVGKLLGLDTQRMIWALGLAATMPVGLREMFGTMTKSFHPGRAAQNGFTAALLAEKGYTSSDQGIEAKRGWANVLSTRVDYKEITDGLGEHFEVCVNTYKPFACGIVIHPAIDGCVQLRTKHHINPDDVESVALNVHHLVLELTGKTKPRTGLEGKFSVFHASAMALIDGACGEPQFSDEAVVNPRVTALRDRVRATVDPAIAPDEVRIVLTMKDGTVHELHVEHAIGSIARPMRDADLEAKFNGLVVPILGEARTSNLLSLCWNIESQSEVSTIANAARL
jgi:2-methylcitrate dehydratase PrpD